MEEKANESKVLNITKKIFIEFLIIVFIVGFFSKSFINYSLPKVSTLSIFQGTYEKHIPVEGSVEYKDVFDVRLGTNVVVAEYFVEPGKVVDRGAKVFRVDATYGFSDFQHQIKEVEIEIEKEKNTIENLLSDYLILGRKLDLMEAKIKGEEGKLALMKENNEVPLKHEEQKQLVELLKIEHDIEKMIFDRKKIEVDLKVKLAEVRILGLKEELHQLQGQALFFSSLDGDGIYYSEVKGQVLNINKRNSIILSNETVVEMAVVPEEVDQRASFTFIGYMPEKYGHFFRNGGGMLIRLTNIEDPIRIIIREIHYDSSRDAFRIVGEPTVEIPHKVILTKQYKGVAAISSTGEKIVPRSAVVVQRMVEGSKGHVFIIETEEGVLGRHHTARAVEITILDVGDQYVSVAGLDGYEGRRVIANVSHKIKDGVKVQYGN